MLRDMETYYSLSAFYFSSLFCGTLIIVYLKNKHCKFDEIWWLLVVTSMTLVTYEGLNKMFLEKNDFSPFSINNYSVMVSSLNFSLLVIESHWRIFKWGFNIFLFMFSKITNFCMENELWEGKKERWKAMKKLWPQSTQQACSRWHNLGCSNGEDGESVYTVCVEWRAGRTCE